MDRAAQLRHFNANKRCHDPCNIHLDKKKRYKPRFKVTKEYAEIHQDLGIYEGQRLCTGCQIHISSTKPECNDIVTDHPPSTLPTQSTGRGHSSDIADRDISMLDFEFIHEQLITVKEKLMSINSTGMRNVQPFGPNITKEVSKKDERAGTSRKKTN